jgi:hypothetical protein
MVGLALASFVDAPSMLRAAAVGVAVVLGWYVLQGSRIAWSFILVDAVGGFGQTLIAKGLSWELVFYVPIIVGLSVPVSFRFVWRGREETLPRVQRVPLLHEVQTAMYRAFAYLVSWESGVKREGPWDAQGYRSILGRVGLFTLLSLPLVVTTYQWEQNSASPLASVLADVAWTIYAILQIIFIVLCAMGLYRYLTRNRSESRSKIV